jgi:hypothetical protein
MTANIMNMLSVQIQNLGLTQKHNFPGILRVTKYFIHAFKPHLFISFRISYIMFKLE